MWSALPKTQRRVVTLRYSPCDNTPSAAMVALMTGEVFILICKNIFFVSILLLAVHCRSDTPPVISHYSNSGNSGSIFTWAVRNAMSQRT
jgi:hypothetical protein